MPAPNTNTAVAAKLAEAKSETDWGYYLKYGSAIILLAGLGGALLPSTACEVALSVAALLPKLVGFAEYEENTACEWLRETPPMLVTATIAAGTAVAAMWKTRGTQQSDAKDAAPEQAASSSKKPKLQ